MADFSSQYALWDEFLALWPPSRLATMTIDEYTRAGSKDTFTYWIESRLDQMGSIWGGSAFKFGVFSRADTVDKANDGTLSYSGTHGWYTHLGSTAGEAFEAVRSLIVKIAALAADGDVQGIESLTQLGEAYKWKIAFHYQDRLAPSIVAIYKRPPLAIDSGMTSKASMAMLQQAAIGKRPAEIGLLEFSRDIWEAWSRMNLVIFKLSHGNDSFSTSEQKDYLNRQLAVLHKDTVKGQGAAFMQAPVGTLFHLCHGNSPQRVCQFTSEHAPCGKGDGWIQRSYRTLSVAHRNDRYTSNSKYWSPQGNSTFWKVGEEDLPEFEQTLLVPYFGITLAELAALAGEPLEAAPPVPAPSTKGPACEGSRKPINQIFYGPPGTGKTFALGQLLKRDYAWPGEKSRCAFVTFHQSYGYEEFVEGLRPRLAGDEADGAVAYEIRAGAFKQLCERARMEPTQRFAMVIDEINRGNISKIFGELITLIEADKRDGAEHAVFVTLPYSGERFSVPANVDLFGTMNTADRSLALLDTALRRRFDFVAVMPDGRDEPGAPLHGLRVMHAGLTVDIPVLLETMNRRIEALYDKDHTIGHAYFTALKGVADGEARFVALAEVFRHRIVPLLEEYFFEDWHKMQLVLGDHRKADPDRFVTTHDAHEQDIERLFGDGHGLDPYSTRRRYAIQSEAFERPQAYLGIYQSVLP